MIWNADKQAPMLNLFSFADWCVLVCPSHILGTNLKLEAGPDGFSVQERD